MGGFLIRGWEVILPGFGGTSALARGATLAARWLHEPQPISNQPVGLGFSNPAGRYRPGGSSFSSLGCWSKDMGGFLTRGWELILPECGGTSALSRGATLAAGWLHEPEPISNHLVGLGFPNPAGRYRPGESAFSYPGCCSCRDMEGFLTRGWEIILIGIRWLYVRSLSSQRSASGTGVCTTFGAVSTRGLPFSSPSSRSCICMEGFLIRGWDSVVPGWRWLFFEPQPISDRPAWSGFPHHAGRFRPG